MLAANEVATNSVRHGGGSGLLQIWRGAEEIFCEVRDPGRITDPLVGRRRPGVAEPLGRGLWVAHQVCDLVQIRWDGETSSASGCRPPEGPSSRPPTGTD